MKDNVYIKIYCAIEHNNKVMLTQDIEGRPGWKFPGGHIEKGELILEGIEREIKEETGYHIKVKELIAIEDYFHHKRKNEHNLNFFVTAQLIGGKERLRKGEVKRIKWFFKKELRRLKKNEVYCFHCSALKKYLKNKRYPIDLMES